MITIEVRGIPAPQGNHRVNRSGAMYETSKAVGPWREAVRAETQKMLTDSHSRYTEPGLPVAVQIDFYMPRPKSAPRKVTLPARKPDIDKLARAVLDGLVDGGAIHDDGQVTTLSLTKSFASDIHPAGASIVIELDHDLDAEGSQ